MPRKPQLNTLLVVGLALYLRALSTRRHGTPDDLAARFEDHGLKWAAIAGPWHDTRGQRLINDARTCRRYADALAKRGIKPFVWGYPWQGTERQFAKQMRQCAGDHALALLDPELGSNPSRQRRGLHKRTADEHARVLVACMAEERFDVCGLSSFGSGVRLGWFPMEAFVQALVEHFRDRTFVGGQTYTEDNRVDPSIADYLGAIERAGMTLEDVELVPNFGTYKFVPKDPSLPLSAKNRKAVPKTDAELHAHLCEFIDESEPVHAMIGWAENFMNARLWRTLARFADWMERGACALPPRA